MANESRPCPCGIGDRFDYEGCGKEVQVEHIKAYACKQPASADKAVVVIHDIFAWQLPNTRYRAMSPPFFAGREAWKPSDDWSKFDDRLKTQDARKISKEADAVLKYVKEQCGVKKLGVIGFCWGGVAVCHLMMTYPELKDGVSLYGHPTGEEAQTNCEVDYEVKIYPGQTHGFVHRKREDINPQDKPFIEEGRKDMIIWLNKYL